MKNKKIAYAIWPWGTESEEQFVAPVKDIREAGYTCFESVGATVDLFLDRPERFAQLLEEYQVKPISFYIHLKGSREEVEDFAKKAPFMAQNGIKTFTLQATHSASKEGATEEELRFVLDTTNQIADIAAGYGLLPCFHPHINTSVQFENEIDFLMRNTDPAKVAMAPDTAHLLGAKCDPVQIISRYADRVKFVHLKDFEGTAEVAAAGWAAGVEVYENFVELGRGSVDFPGVFRVLDQAGFDGYYCIELDESKFGNKESAVMSRKYLESIEAIR